jgi:hypothetical protein
VRAKSRKMAEAYRLHNLLVAAKPYPQYKYLTAFKTGYGIAQLRACPKSVNRGEGDAASG